MPIVAISTTYYSIVAQFQYTTPTQKLQEIYEIFGKTLLPFIHSLPPRAFLRPPHSELPPRAFRCPLLIPNFRPARSAAPLIPNFRPDRALRGRGGSE